MIAALQIKPTVFVLVWIQSPFSTVGSIENVSDHLLSAYCHHFTGRSGGSFWETAKVAKLSEITDFNAVSNSL